MKITRILPFLVTAPLLFFLGFTSGKFSEEPVLASDAFEQFAVDALVDSLRSSGRPYLPFLNRSTLRCGIYRLAAGAADGQSPHTQDEVYYVLKGKAKFKVEEESSVVQTGDVLFVGAKATHQFYDIEEDLELLVFFSTKEPD